MASPSCPGLLVREGKEVIIERLGSAIWNNTQIELTLMDIHGSRTIHFIVEFLDNDKDGQVIYGRTEDGRTLNLHLYHNLDQTYISFE